MVVPSQPPIIIVSQPNYYPVNYNSGYSAYPYNYGYPSYNYGFVPVFYPVNTGHRDHGHDGDGGGGHTGGAGGGQIVHNDFNPAGLPIPLGGNLLPIPTGNVLPIPSGNLLPIPTSSVQPIPSQNTLPVPTRSVAPVPANNLVPVTNHVSPPVPLNQGNFTPTVSPGLPTNNAGTNRNPKMVN